MVLGLVVPQVLNPPSACASFPRQAGRVLAASLPWLPLGAQSSLSVDRVDPDLASTGPRPCGRARRVWGDGKVRKAPSSSLFKLLEISHDVKPKP